jgi:hypothetical protein
MEDIVHSLRRLSNSLSVLNVSVAKIDSRPDLLDVSQRACGEIIHAANVSAF